MPDLVDQFCPNVHDAPITAVDFDPTSGTIATADETGVVAIQRPGESSAKLVFQPGTGVLGALSLIPGGAMVAVGDDQGTVGVYRTDNGEPTFQEIREGARGRVRSMRGIAINAEGSRLAAIAIDGLLRVWDLVKYDRNAWKGFSGNSVAFDGRGERVLAMDSDGQPRLMDLLSLQALYMDKLQTPAERAAFTRDDTMVIAAGPSGISLLQVSDGALVASFATRGGSGISNLVLSPDGSKAGAITQRSVHLFTLPELEPIDSLRHGAPNPTGAAAWLSSGVKVAGSDGLLHSGGGGAAGPVQVVGGFGAHLLAGHGSSVAYWQEDQRSHAFPLDQSLRELHVDRDGRLLVALPENGPLQVFDCLTGKQVFKGGPETKDCPTVAVGGSVVAAQLATGGCRWWDLGENRAYELAWPRTIALSNGGTWLGVVTPRGLVKVLDPADGRDAMPQPIPLAEVPVRMLTFVNRRPDLLVLDEEGVLGHYDLANSIREQRPVEGTDVLTINVDVDRMWGVTGGKFCALRLPAEDTCSILFVDIGECSVTHEVTGLHPRSWVNAENGRILEPGRASSIVERDRDGKEVRVLRALPGDEWISFGWNGILQASDGASEAM